MLQSSALLSTPWRPWHTETVYLAPCFLFSTHLSAYITNKNTWQSWPESLFLPSNFSWVPSLCCHQCSARSTVVQKMKIKSYYSCFPITLLTLWDTVNGLNHRLLRNKDNFSLGTKYCIGYLHLKQTNNNNIGNSVFTELVFFTNSDSPKAPGIFLTALPQGKVVYL